MAHSLLCERLQVFFSSLPFSHAPPPTPRAPTSTPPTNATPTPASSQSRLKALEYALDVASAALSEERARRMKWERRAVVAKAEQATQREELVHSERRRKQLEKELSMTYASAEYDRSMRRVAEEHRQVAIERLVEGADKVMMTLLEKDNKVLRERLYRLNAEFCKEKEQLQIKNAALRTEMTKFRGEAQREREEFVTELAERTKNLAKLEMELRDARQTYITAARTLEAQRRDTMGEGRGEVKLGTARREMKADNDPPSKQLTCKAKRDSSERLSSSYVWEKGSCDSVVKKVEELDLTTEGVSDEAERLRRKVAGLEDTAAQKEQEAAQWRCEMAAIHSKMRRLAALPLPKGAEELLGDDKDVKRLAGLSEGAKSKGVEVEVLQKEIGPTNRVKLSQNMRLARPRPQR